MSGCIPPPLMNLIFYLERMLLLIASLIKDIHISYSYYQDSKPMYGYMCPWGRERYPIQQLLYASADTKVKMYTTLPGKGENSPSNEHWTKCLHPGKRWCRNTGSSENHSRSVSIHSACSFFHLTWPAVLEQSGNNLWGVIVKRAFCHAFVKAQKNAYWLL